MNYEDMKKEAEELNKKLTAAGEKYFKELTAKLFDENPKLESFGWRQYTPYFNDGDTCTFGVYADEPEINGVSSYDEPEEDDNLTEEERNELSKKISKLVYAIRYEDLERIFGDHVSVTIHRDGKIDKDEYNHN